MAKRARSGGNRSTEKRRKVTKVARRRPRMNSKLMLKMARRAVLKTCETKYISAASENNQLFHNGGAVPTFVWYSNMLATNVGTNQTTRLGDEVYGVGLSIRLWLSKKLDRPNVTYRIMVVAGPPGDVTLASLFKGTSGNRMLDYVDTDKYSVVYHKILQPMSGDYSLESGATNKEHSRLLKIWIPTKGKIQYQVDGGAIPKYQSRNLNLVVLAYDTFGSLTTDNIASFAGAYRFYFKDP